MEGCIIAEDYGCSGSKYGCSFETKNCYMEKAQNSCETDMNPKNLMSMEINFSFV